MTEVCKKIVDALGCEYELFENETDGAVIKNRYTELLKNRNGYTPVIIPVDGNLADMMEWALGDDKGGIVGILERAREIDADAFFDERREEIEEYAADYGEYDEPDVLPDASEECFSGYSDYSGGLVKEIIIAKISCENPWELAAYVPMGGFNDCPQPEQQCAVFKRWYERYGAVPAVVTGDTWELYTEKAVENKAEADKLAQEMYLFCTDIVDQGVGEIGRLAGFVNVSHIWFFWWD